MEADCTLYGCYLSPELSRMLLTFMAEFIGTALLIMLGDGVVANVCLNKSNMKGAGSVQITIAWGFAVLLPAFIFAKWSGALFNPALTIALAVDGVIAWSSVPVYFLGQIAGAFTGAVIVYILFKAQFDATEDGNTKLGVFCTAPAVPNKKLNFLSEFIGTMVLVFAIKGIVNVTGCASGVEFFLIFAIIVSIGMSLGGLTGYAINPARDLGPRIAHAVLPIKNKRDSNWGYSWIPICAPICGALAGSALFNLLLRIEAVANL